MDNVFRWQLPRPTREQIARAAVAITNDVARRVWFLPHHDRGWGDAFYQIECAILDMVRRLR